MSEELLEPIHEFANLRQLSDEELARRFQQGCKQAGDELFARHKTQLCAYAHKLYRGCDERDFEDLLQEARLTGLAKFSEFEPRNYFAWMKGIIRNMARNWVRQQFIEWKGFGTRDAEIDIDEVTHARVERDVEANLMLGELVGLLRQLLAGLEVRDRIVAAFMLDLFEVTHEFPSVRQIETGLHLSHGNVQRSREAILQVWRPECVRRGFWPLL